MLQKVTHSDLPMSNNSWGRAHFLAPPNHSLQNQPDDKRPFLKPILWWKVRTTWVWIFLPPGGPYLGHRPGQGHLQRKYEDKWTYHTDTWPYVCEPRWLGPHHDASHWAAQGILTVLQVEKCLAIIVLPILQIRSDIRWARLPPTRKRVEKVRNQLQS